MLLKASRWQFKVNIPPTPKCLVCVAPHTSNWDFIVGEMCIRSIGMKVGFMMKEQWFFWPLGSILKGMGGVPVRHGSKADKSKRGSATAALQESFAQHDSLAVAITPEGTRSANPNWHKGMLVIAAEAQVPIVLAYIDYRNRVACLDRIFTPTGDLDADLLAIKQYYHALPPMAKNPKGFTTGL